MTDEAAPRPMDPDVDLHVPQQRDELLRAPARVLGVIAAGGAIGACARYSASLAWPAAAGAFPWSTFAVNGLGCALIGVLMVTVTEARPATHPLVRPFFGTGVLGGFTTFSTYAVDVERLLADGEAELALGYLAATVAAALAAVWLGTAAARQVWRRIDWRRIEPGSAVGGEGGRP